MSNKPSIPIVSDYCHLAGFERVTSIRTGSVIIHNLSESKFLIHPDWSVAATMAALDAWEAAEPYKRLDRKPLRAIFTHALAALKSVETRGAFSGALSAIIHTVHGGQNKEPGLPATRPLLAEMLLFFWSHNCVVWPASKRPLPNWKAFWGRYDWGKAAALVAAMAERFATQSSQSGALNKCFQLLLTSRSIVSDVRDVCPGSKPQAFSARDASHLLHVAKELIAEQRKAEPGGTHYKPEQFAISVTGQRIEVEPEFEWAEKEGERLAIWREDARSFLRGVTASRKAVCMAVNAWLKLAIDEPSIPSNPVEMFDKKRWMGRGLEAQLSTGCSKLSMAYVKKFLQYSLEKHCSEFDEVGETRVALGFGNPLTELGPSGKRLAAESFREPIPLRIVNLCISILTENDYAWPKALNRKRFGSDWFRWRRPTDGKSELIWSPVRCFALLAKLMLPARTFQIRMLDSGEADSERYDPVSGSWEDNHNRLARSNADGKDRSRAQKGVFRKFTRQDKTPGSLIFFNTNKTADIDIPADKRGYVMPWEHHKALALFGQLRDWQEEFNPLPHPTPWKDVIELRMRDPAQLRDWGYACFLMRDPTVIANPTLPITDKKVNTLWDHLLLEAERRLAKSGERHHNGEEIKLTSRTSRGAIKPLFDLHSLRVTMITSLYEQGVPPEFIMKVAGHASVLMTLYYVKINGAEISRRLNEANAQTQKSEQVNWLGHLQNKKETALKQLTARSHDSAIDAFAGSCKTGIVIMDHGFCPLGAQRCADGLVISSDYADTIKFGAVPGGPANCSRCRFFISGPAFLGGLEAKFNDLIFKTQCASREYEKAQRHYEEELDSAARAAEAGEFPGGPRRSDRALAAYERSAAEVDSLLVSLHATYRLIEQCLEIANREEPSCSEGFSLVVAKEGADKIEAMLDDVGQYEQLNRICQAAEIYEGLTSGAQIANARRMRGLDRLLQQSGLNPVFSMIDNDELALKVSNEMALS